MKLQHQKYLAIAITDILAITAILAIAVILAIAAILAISGHKEKPQLSCATVPIRRSSIKLNLFKTTHT